MAAESAVRFRYISGKRKAFAITVMSHGTAVTCAIPSGFPLS